MRSEFSESEFVDLPKHSRGFSMYRINRRGVVRSPRGQVLRNIGYGTRRVSFGSYSESVKNLLVEAFLPGENPQDYKMAGGWYHARNLVKSWKSGRCAYARWVRVESIDGDVLYLNDGVRKKLRDDEFPYVKVGDVLFGNTIGNALTNIAGWLDWAMLYGGRMRRDGDEIDSPRIYTIPERLWVPVTSDQVAEGWLCSEYGYVHKFSKIKIEREKEDGVTVDFWEPEDVRQNRIDAYKYQQDEFNAREMELFGDSLF